MELQTIAGSVRLANLKALIQKEDMARIQALTIDPAGALERGLKIGITSQEVDLKEDEMMWDMVSKSICSFTRESSENLFEESHDEDSDWIQEDEPDNDLNKDLSKIISKTEKDLYKNNW